jgi:hypothetical protein
LKAAKKENEGIFVYDYTKLTILNRERYAR